MVNRTVVDNSVIEAFFSKCQKIASRWNAGRHDGGGEIRATLEDMQRHTTQKMIRIDAEPDPVYKNEGRMTLLQIWYDAARGVMLAKTPGLPIDNTQPITIRGLRQTLEHFNP